MSRKIVNPLLIAAAIAVNVVPGVGQLASIGLLSTTATTVIGTVTALGVSAALSTVAGIAGLGPKSPKATLSQLDRLNASINPSASRKFVFGRGPMGTDIRYVEPSGTDQEYVDYIIACAAHRVSSIDELWIDDLLAWTPGTGAQGKYAGYLSVTPILEGNALNYIPINGGYKWGSTRRLTGCAYIHVRIKRTGNSKKTDSPFASGGLSSRLTIVGNGAPVYDPRLDSTVAGGSGSQRSNDQSTWSFNASGLGQGSNIALQTLTYQLGWRIAGKLSVGPGTPAARLALPSYITAANLCDETVLRADGATERRYTGAGVFGEDMEPASVLDAQCTACNGAIRDAGGKLELIVRHNDLASVMVDLSDDDVLGPATWEPVPELQEAYNVVRGRYVDPSANSLYQLVDYPEVRIDSADGVDRVLTLDLPLIDGAARAQRIAKQVLQRRQYRGKFTADFGARAWNAKVGDIVRLTLSASGWAYKLFRVEAQLISITGSCPMVLREETPNIYLWEADDRAPVQAATPTRFDPTLAPYVLAIDDASQSATTVNKVYLSQFERGGMGWATHNPSGLAVVAFQAGLLFSTRYLQFQATATGAGQEIGLFTDAPYRFAVTAGDTLCVQAGIQALGVANQSRLQIQFFDATGTYVSDATETYPGSASYETKRYFMTTVPAGAVRANIVAYASSAGAGTIDLALTQPMVSSVSPAQGIRPAFAPGPNGLDGADPTGANIAAGIANQGTGATANSLADLDPGAAEALAALNGGLQVIRTDIGTSASISKLIAAGGLVRATAGVSITSATASHTGVIEIQVDDPSSGWTTIATGLFSYGSFEPGATQVSGDYSNTTGADRLFDFRVVITAPDATYDSNRTYLVV